MSDIAQTTVRARSSWLACGMAAAIAANLFAIVTVNYWIYYARMAFIAAHPDYVAVQPPTISRAISDPAIGEPFAFWISLSAIFLTFGVAGIGLVILRIARTQEFASRRGRVTLMAIAIGAVLAQAVAAAGMHMLSSYRFPDHNAMHMVGSYTFFVAQALVIVLGILFCTTLLASRVTMDGLERAGLMRRPWVVFRKWFGVLSLGLTVAYMALFQIKGMDFGAANGLFYATYVLVEPVVITSFLLFLGMFQTDLWAVARGRSKT